jgi:acetone carboxylase gamma subunit
VTRRRASRTLAIEAGHIVCSACGHVLGVEGAPWKQEAALSVVPVHAMAGASMTAQPEVVLRRFSCPGCGALLDTETAMPDDPFLDDVLDAQPPEEGGAAHA